MTTEQIKQVQIGMLESLKVSKASNPELPWEFVIDTYLARIQEPVKREKRCTHL
jgi:hypothetical protein